MRAIDFLHRVISALLKFQPSSGNGRGSKIKGGVSKSGGEGPNRGSIVSNRLYIFSILHLA